MSPNARAVPRHARARNLVVLAAAGALLLCGSGCAERESVTARGDREGVLHRGIGTEIESFDPHVIRGAPEWSIAYALFEGLMIMDPATGRPVPGAAERMEVSADGKTFAFTLREGLRWSNGDPLDAGDFVFAARRLLSPGIASAHAEDVFAFVANAMRFQRGELADFGAVGIRREGPLRVVFELESPVDFFPAMLTQFMPVHRASVEAAGAFDARNTGWARPGSLVGNGPFRLVSHVQNQEIVVERNPHARAAADVRLNAVRYYPIENADTEETSFRNGQLHVTAALPSAKVETWQREQPGVARLVPAGGTAFYTVNVARPHLADARVRRALSLALDREAIARYVARRGQEPAFTFVPPVYPGYRSAARLVHDPERARALLAEAGYPGGRGYPGIDLLVDSRDQHRLIAEAAQEQWQRELGIEVRISSQETRVLIASKNAREFDLARGSWNSALIGPWYFLAPLVTGGLYNEPGWSDARYDALVAEALAAVDPVARESAWQRAEALLLEEAPVIPIHTINAAFLMAPSVTGWHPTDSADRYVRFLGLDPALSSR